MNNCRQYLIPLFLIVLLFTSCTSGNKFVSSFGKRHYTKGFFWDSPGREQRVASNPIKRNFKPEIGEKPSIVLSDKKEIWHAGTNTTPTVVKRQEEQVQNKPAKEEVKQASQIQENKQDSGDEKKDTKDQRTGKALLAGGIIALIAGVLMFSNSAGIAIVLILLAITLLISGVVLIFSGEGTKNKDDESDSKRANGDYIRPSGKPIPEMANQSDMGVVGFLLVITGVIIWILAFFVAIILFALSFISGSVGSSILLALLILFGLALIIAGFVVCLEASLHSDKHLGLASAGLVVSSIILLLLLLVVIHAL